MTVKFNYAKAVELLEKHANAEDVPENVLSQLNIDSENPDIMEWFEENYGAIKAGYKDNNDWEEDNLNLMDPDGDGR